MAEALIVGFSMFSFAVSALMLYFFGLKTGNKNNVYPSVKGQWS
jgi:hypothetical protein